MADRKVILHYHIFKNAGTSFNTALAQVFGPAFMEFDGAEAGSVIEPDRIGEIIRNHPGKNAFSTHQGMLSSFGTEGTEVLTTLLLRHPLSRISSIYHFERSQQSNSPGAVNAKRLSFGDYLRWRWDQSPAFFCFQSFYCARSPESRGYQPLETIHDRARRNLDQLHCVGTVERFPEFISRAQNLVDLAGGSTTMGTFHANISGSSASDHDAIRERIIEETDRSFHDQIDPLIRIDEALWSAY